MYSPIPRPVVLSFCRRDKAPSCRRPTCWRTCACGIGKAVLRFGWMERVEQGRFVGFLETNTKNGTPSKQRRGASTLRGCSKNAHWGVGSVKFSSQFGTSLARSTVKRWPAKTKEPTRLRQWRGSTATQRAPLWPASDKRARCQAEALEGIRWQGPGAGV